MAGIASTQLLVKLVKLGLPSVEGGNFAEQSAVVGGRGVSLATIINMQLHDAPI